LNGTQYLFYHISHFPNAYDYDNLKYLRRLK
jgi:hypothetical protein